MLSRPILALLPALFAIQIALPKVAGARVVRFVVERTESPALNGESFGSVGQYRKLTGRFFGELDPRDPSNALITDLASAPRNSRGKVEYSATFTLLAPVDPAKSTDVLLYEVPNRGHIVLSTKYWADALHAGHAVLFSGWQGDLDPQNGLEAITVPVAHSNGKTDITGPVLVRLANLPAGSHTAPLNTGYGGLKYQFPETLDTTRALLTAQASEDGEMVPIKADDWAFADCEARPFPGTPHPNKICLKSGFDPALLYQLVFTAKDPLVLGIGFAATRDLVAFLRHSTVDADGTANPLAGKLRFAIAFGTSQSGNFLRSFLNLGFNQDESQRKVFDGMNPNIAARQCAVNIRFAIPGGAANRFEPGSEGVLWWTDYRDEERGRRVAGLLDRCRATNTCPKIVETFGSSEFWGLRMSPDLVGTRANQDIPLPAEVRRYYFPGVTHGGGQGGFRTDSRPAPGGTCALADNPNPTADSMRALRLALIDWVVHHKVPPPSRYPTLSRGELAPPDHLAMGFPMIPGEPLPDNLINPFFVYDYGPDFNYNDLSGVISFAPPTVRQTIPMLVPRTNADGNETSGIASVLMRVPLGTYLGWNVTASGYFKGRGCGFAGGFIPFARTKAERLANGDPRPSLEERYSSHEAYVKLVREAAARMVQEGFLLQEDADRTVKEASASDVARE
jgi:hypothetical protein